MIGLPSPLGRNGRVTRGIVNLPAFLVVAYAAFAGWRGAHGPANPKTHEFDAATTQQKLGRAAIFAVVGVALALLGLYYVLPATSFLGRKGEGIPIHTYGLL